MTQGQLPQESESQRIGEYAVKSFEAKVGSEIVDKSGDSDALNSTKEYFSVSLEAKTVNFYHGIQDEVILIFVDLTENEDPRKCTAYYKWITDEVRDIVEQELLEGKKTHTFRVPVVNVFDENLDVQPHLEDKYDRAIALNTIYDAVKARSAEPHDVLRAVGERIKATPSTLPTLLHSQNRPWLVPASGTYAKQLKDIDELITARRYDIAKQKIDELFEKDLSEAPHELSELHYLRAQYFIETGKPEGTIEDLKTAEYTSPEIWTYRYARIQESIFENFDDLVALSKLKEELIDDDDPNFSSLKATLLTYLGDYDDALELIEKINIESPCLELANLYLAMGEYDKCYKECTKCLENKSNLNQEQELILYVLRSQASNQLAIAGIKDSEKRSQIPVSGVPSMDSKHLASAWEDLKYGWQLARKLNYPRQIESMVDLLLAAVQ